MLDAKRLQHLQIAARQRTVLTEQIARFEAAGISVVLLKGSAFAGYLYRQNAPRTAGDIDLLVAPSDFAHVRKIMAEQGFQEHDLAGRRVTVRIGHERGYLTPESDPILIEIHRGLTHQLIFPIDLPALMRASLPHPDFRRTTVRILAPEDNLIHLAVHGFHHLTLASHGLLDAHELICQKTPNWKRLQKRADSYQAKTALFCLLKNLAGALDTPVPPSVLAKLRPPIWQAHLSDALYSVRPHQRTALFRVIQLLGQLAIPDNKLRVLAFHHAYAALRCLDLIEDRCIRR